MINNWIKQIEKIKIFPFKIYFKINLSRGFIK